MSLSFLKPAEEDFVFLRFLYEQSFPPYERRAWAQLESMLSLPDMQVMIAKWKDTSVGFAIYWQIEGWYFLEHLAVPPQQEGKGYGSEMMRWLLQQSNNKLLLEAELPTDEASHRRVRFYHKLGLAIAPFLYQQPPYRRGEAAPAMHILSAPVITDASVFIRLTTAIRQQVFEAFYSKTPLPENIFSSKI